ncbi:hypothetical protein DSM112329_02573 [Paraconexibacter sp. AEG42_29]|uniref:Uncharacterized protein n=2 Tax=Paraconexibacter sp. AEG42_29 TaxID=2997339 RepID=A0AAU7AVH0_9ACTN
MYMYATAIPGGVVVHAYKHCSSREYLFLDDVGDAYRYQPVCRGYSRVRLDTAVLDPYAFDLLFGQVDPEALVELRGVYERANRIASSS